MLRLFKKHKSKSTERYLTEEEVLLAEAERIYNEISGRPTKYPFEFKTVYKNFLNRKPETLGTCWLRDAIASKDARKIAELCEDDTWEMH